MNRQNSNFFYIDDDCSFSFFMPRTYFQNILVAKYPVSYIFNCIVSFKLYIIIKMENKLHLLVGKNFHSTASKQQYTLYHTNTSTSIIDQSYLKIKLDGYLKLKITISFVRG